MSINFKSLYLAINLASRIWSPSSSPIFLSTISEFSLVLLPVPMYLLPSCSTHPLSLTQNLHRPTTYLLSTVSGSLLEHKPADTEHKSELASSFFLSLCLFAVLTSLPSPVSNSVQAFPKPLSTVVNTFGASGRPHSQVFQQLSICYPLQMVLSCLQSHCTTSKKYQSIQLVLHSWQHLPDLDQEWASQSELPKHYHGLDSCYKPHLP